MITTTSRLSRTVKAEAPRNVLVTRTWQSDGYCSICIKFGDQQILIDNVGDDGDDFHYEMTARDIADALIEVCNEHCNLPVEGE